MAGRWRYVPPNLVTCVNLLGALISISESIAGNHISAAWFLVLCALLDKADGFLARLFNASSRFGVELDSLADLIAFGVAPAVLCLSYLVGRGSGANLPASAAFRYFVYIGSFLYVVAAALRLAKFNVRTEEFGTRHFFGIPTTLCGGLVGTYFLTVQKHSLSEEFIIALPGLLLVLGVLMVSRIPLPKVGLGRSLPFKVFALVNSIGVYICGISRQLPEYLFVAALGYLLIGSSASMIRGVKQPRSSPPSGNDGDDDGDEAEEDEEGADRSSSAVTPSPRNA
jgi:CDP-diacylglycerol--serine O-phosphatidyltransferase